MLYFCLHTVYVYINVSYNQCVKKLFSLMLGGGSLTGSGGSSGGIVGVQGIGSGNKPLMNQESFDNLIYPFLTMKRFPPNFIIHLGKFFFVVGRFSVSVYPLIRLL